MLGKCQAMLAGYDSAEQALARAASLAPASAFVHLWHGHALREANKPEAAIAAYERAALLDPADVNAAIGAALTTPIIYADESEIARWRARYARGIERLLVQEPGRDWWKHVLKLEWSNFYVAYQGGNDRDLQAGYSAFIDRLLSRAVPQWQQPLATPGTPSDRLHVAFVSAHFRNHTVADYFGRWITDLSRERFRVSVFHTGHSADARTDEFRAAADRFAHVPDDAQGAASALATAKPDVIVYPDVGMSPIDSVLVNLRLAPTQVAAWGHPVTTGSRHVDAYFSCREMEPPDAAGHYAERLVLLPGIGVDYRPRVAIREATREQFRLPADGHVYVCPQSLFKIHPATDALPLDILAVDAKAVLVLFAVTAKGQMDAFVARITGAMARQGLAMKGQIKFLPKLPREVFLGLLGVADVMLDPLQWSGGNTALDALSVGLPIITLPGSEMRGRQSAAMLRLIGVDELIARDRADYVRRALAVGGDAGYRAELSRRIIAGLPAILERRDATAAFAEAVEQVHAARAAGR